MSKDQPPQRKSTTGDRESGQAQFGALLMTDGGAQRGGPPALFRGLTEAERARVLARKPEVSTTPPGPIKMPLPLRR